MRVAVLLVAGVVAGCGGSGDSSNNEGEPVGDTSSSETAIPETAVDDTAVQPMDVPDVPAMTDLDGDGLDDAYEQKIATDYLPFMSLDPSDGCPRSVTVFRLYPHPRRQDDTASPHRRHTVRKGLRRLRPRRRQRGVRHDDRSEQAGAGGHPQRARDLAPEHALRVGHQLRRVGGYDACTTATRNGKPFPVVFFSKNKHGAYMSEGKCDNACFFTNFCVLAPTPHEPKLINAGEPGKPLVTDLTAAGFITTANGWTEMSVFNYDVWGGKEFSSRRAGKVNEDLIDPAFLTPACP